MKKNSLPQKSIVYQTRSGALALRGDFMRETVWATQAQIAEVFNVDVRTINEHIKNIYKKKNWKKIQLSGNS